MLDKYRDRLCTFNDDIQGTGAVTLAGLLAAAKVNASRISEQRIVMFGAGSAATGIAEQIVAAMMTEGLSLAEARARLWLIDIGGLVHAGRTNLEDIAQPYAQPLERLAGWNGSNADHITLAEVVKHVQPTILIGTAAQPGAFTQDIIAEMSQHVARPTIFPLSNPTSRCEAKPDELLAWTAGRAIVATGSPYPDVPPEIAGGDQPRKIGQCNNAFIFPGVGLGVIATQARRVTQQMFVTAAYALSELSPALHDPLASLFPPMNEVRAVSKHVALAVAAEACRSGLADAADTEDPAKKIEATMWEPHYAHYRKI
jgi:malate dehydrogenase (oxaloacetate-decarboxylating)